MVFVLLSLSRTRMVVYVWTNKYYVWANMATFISSLQQIFRRCPGWAHSSLRCSSMWISVSLVYLSLFHGMSKFWSLRLGRLCSFFESHRFSFSGRHLVWAVPRACYLWNLFWCEYPLTHYHPSSHAQRAHWGRDYMHYSQGLCTSTPEDGDDCFWQIRPFPP